jgi:hypothetical protein
MPDSNSCGADYTCVEPPEAATLKTALGVVNVFPFRSGRVFRILVFRIKVHNA